MIDLAFTRLANQQISSPKFKHIPDVVGWMGAMQAQDYAMVKWAVGVRLPGVTDRQVEAAFNHVENLRTHLLRPTWHLTAAEDIHWLLELSAPRIKARMKSRHKELGITPDILQKSGILIREMLTGGRHRTKEELVAELEREGFAADESRAYHLLAWAELDGLLCSGRVHDKQQTYALLEERAPGKQTISRSEALAKLAGRYFSSHGPASLRDFTWWSGLSTSEAKKAVSTAAAELCAEDIGPECFWFARSVQMQEPDYAEQVFLLPAFDEFIISYADRSAVMTSQNHKKAVSSNGIFRPVIVWGGQVIGIWRRTTKRHSVIIEADFFNQPEKSTIALTEQAAQKYGAFLEKEVEFSVKTLK